MHASRELWIFFNMVRNLLDLVLDLLACILCICFFAYYNLCLMKNYFLYCKGTNNLTKSVIRSICKSGLTLMIYSKRQRIGAVTE